MAPPLDHELLDSLRWAIRIALAKVPKKHLRAILTEHAPDEAYGAAALSMAFALLDQPNIEIRRRKSFGRGHRTP